MNRKVLSLEGRRTAACPGDRLLSRRSSDRDIAVCRFNKPPRFCIGYWLYGEGVHSTDLRHSKCSAECRT